MTLGCDTRPERSSWFRALAGLCLAVSLTAAQTPQRESPEASGLVEETRTSLILVDLLVLDGYDRQLHGLNDSDFLARLNGGKWPVETVDELCSCQTIVHPGPSGSSIEIELMTDASGWGCDCLYRVGLVPPEGGTPRRVRSDVKLSKALRVAGYRIERLGEAESWWLEARSATARPERREEIDVEADLVPVHVDAAGWDLSVRVAVDLDSLSWTPVGEDLSGRWEVGAVLIETSSGRTWEMLGLSELKRKGGETRTTFKVLHRRTLHDLAPGPYDVRAVVRDRTTNEFGATKVSLVLPDPTTVAVVEPRAMRPDSPFLPTPLPLRGERKKSQRSSGAMRGSLPVGDAPVPAGEALAFATWVCPREGDTTEPAVNSWIFLGPDAVEIRRSAVLYRLGPCAMITERLNTSGLSPGVYTYYVRWDPGDGIETRRTEATFEIVARDVAVK